MITGLRLENFKAHEALSLEEIPTIAVLVGRNNTGKSTVLHAAAIPKYGWSQEAQLPIGHPSEVLHDIRSNAQIELEYDGSGGHIININPGGGHSSSWQGGATDAVARRVYFLSSQRSAFRQFGYKEFEKDVGTTGERTYNSLHQLKANDDSRFSTIVEWMTQMDMGISSIAAPTVSPGQGAIQPNSYGVPTNITLQGSGTWAILPIVTQGVLCDPGETLLIEEPESHLHRAAINDLWLFLADCARRKVQVICTTHSLDFLASMNERMERGEVPAEAVIYHLRRDETGKTSVDTQDPTVFRRIAKVIKEDLAASD